MRVILAVVAVILAGLALFQITMQPSDAERLELAVIFIVMGVATALAALYMPKLSRKSGHLVVTLFALSVLSVGIAVMGLVIAASRMFLNDHDLTLLLVVLGFGLLAALGFGFAASNALTADLRRMARTAHDVSGGELTARTGVVRADEIGALARDIDEMAERLAEAAAARDMEDARRREFFAAVGHDLRTPLASMQAAIEALRDGVAPDPDRYYRSLQSDVTALHSLVDDLFLLARIQAGDVNVDAVPTDLTDVVDEAFEVMRPVAVAEQVDLVIEAPQRVIVETAPEAVSRVLRNLLDNAIRHAPTGTSVRVLVDKGDTATVSVIDEGPGFSEDFVEQAFDSFTRSDAARTRATGGAGLGLAIAQGIVVALGGEIWAEPGPGGTLLFTLPSG